MGVASGRGACEDRRRRIWGARIGYGHGDRQDPVEAATRRKAVVAATIGNFVEWYDFIIYGYFATVIAA